MQPKQFLFLLLLSFVTLASVAQEKTDEETVTKSNVIKLNLTSLVFKNISLQYERAISRRSTVALNLKMIPFGNIPFKSAAEKAINDPSVDLDKLKIGAFGITPELRYYVGKRGALHGFYLGPFINYNSYKSDLPVTYDNDAKTGIFSGKIKSLTFGLQLGAQWKLGESVYLDWWILGPNYGSASGNLDFAAALSAGDQQDLKDQIQNLKDDLPLNAIKSYEVNGNGATINVKGPWAGIRAMGISLGIAF